MDRLKQKKFIDVVTDKSSNRFNSRSDGGSKVKVDNDKHELKKLVILVDKDDNEVGTKEKLRAHKDGDLHRAISVFLFNSQGQLMLQQRAKKKYHCGGLWSNTVCTHPFPGESSMDAAKRRLGEEMGIEGVELKESFCFTYKVEFDNGLIENEYDHVFIGIDNGEPILNPDEADDWKWIELEKLQRNIKQNPDSYTYWFKKALPKVLEEYID